MPTICSFGGITLSMYWREGNHSTPHFHARYGEHKASIDFAGSVTAGRLPPRQLRLVRAWALLHRAQLDANWRLMVAKKPPNPIPSHR